MHYYIDGYNLMFRVLRADDELQTRRELIIRDLNTKAKLLELQVTLVFDAHYHHYIEGTRSHFNHLEILFSGKGESADELILNELKNKRIPGAHTVVTSDKKLAWLSRLKNAKTESVDEFLAWLNKRFKNKLRKLNSPAPKKELPHIVPLPKVIQPGTTVEESFDYYLQLFEARVVQQKADKVLEKSVGKKEQKRKRNKKPELEEYSEDRFLSDMERWLKAFNNPPPD